MTIHRVYIGDLDDPKFNWEHGDWNGNVPRPLGPDYPDAYFLLFKVIDLIRSGGLAGQHTDYGGWVAKVGKQRLLELIEEWYAPVGWSKDPKQSPHLYEQLQKLRAFVSSLDGQGLYALVALEI
jgi:hypothetical protein